MLPSVHTCGDSSQVGGHKANNSVNQVLDTASQNKFTPREKHNEEEQEIDKFTVLLGPGLGAKWRKIIQW